MPQNRNLLLMICLFTMAALNGCHSQKQIARTNTEITTVTYWDQEKTSPHTVGSLDEQYRQVGLWRTYSSSGQLISVELFEEHGAPELYEGWHANGRLRYYEPLEHGLANGIWEWWDSSGALLAKSELVHGTGIEYQFDEQDCLKRINVWKNGKLIHMIPANISAVSAKKPDNPTTSTIIGQHHN